MNIIVDDVARAAVAGVFGRDPHERKVRIFIDTVSFFGEYSALTAVSGIVSHVADAFCSLCTLTWRERGLNSSILYSAEIHSLRLGYMRLDERKSHIR